VSVPWNIFWSKAKSGSEPQPQRPLSVVPKSACASRSVFTLFSHVHDEVDVRMHSLACKHNYRWFCHSRINIPLVLTLHPKGNREVNNTDVKAHDPASKPKRDTDVILVPHIWLVDWNVVQGSTKLQVVRINEPVFPNIDTQLVSRRHLHSRVIVHHPWFVYDLPY